jgi:hypothetical protein
MKDAHHFDPLAWDTAPMQPEPAAATDWTKVPPDQWPKKCPKCGAGLSYTSYEPYCAYTDCLWNFDDKPARPLNANKSFALTFDPGEFKWTGRAPTMALAEARARAELSATYHTFNNATARLVTMEFIA